MKRIFLILILGVFAFGQDLILGVVPQQSPLKLSKKWIKVTDYLQKATGVNVIFKTEKSIPFFEKELYSGKYDIAYMNPYHFIVANDKQGYEAFVRADKNIIGILLAKEDKVEFTKENLKEFRGSSNENSLMNFIKSLDEYNVCSRIDIANKHLLDDISTKNISDLVLQPDL